MFKQFENPEATKLQGETAARKSADEKIQCVADKAAGKAARTEQEFDKNLTIFTN